MAGSASNVLRSAFVAETTPGTTPATPGFKTLHVPALFTDNQERFHQPTLTAGGALIGDTLLLRDAIGSIKDAPIVYGLYDPLWESLFQASFFSNVLTDAKARNALTFENSIAAGLGGSTTYKRYRGVEAIGGSISADASGVLKFNMDLLGMQTLDSSTSGVTGATYTDSANVDPLSSTGDLGTISIAGYTLDDMVSFTMDFKYDAREAQPKLGGDVLSGITRGAFRPSIKMRFYIDANHAAIYDAARAQNQTPAKVTINIGSVTLKKYKFEFWDCYLDMAAPDYTGANAFLDIVATPVYNRSNSGVMTLTRAIA